MAKNPDATGRTILSNRFRGWRYPVLAAALVMGWIIVANHLWNVWALGVLAVLTLLFYIVTHTKRAQFDTEALYLLKGGREERIPFSDITAAKATGTKLNNGRRVWRIEYKDASGAARRYRFLPRTMFNSMSSSNILDCWPADFLDALDAANPNAVIWWDPFFFHDVPWRQKSQEEKAKA